MKYSNIKKVWAFVFVAMILSAVMVVGYTKAQNVTIHPNEEQFRLYPSDGSAYNEIHRYYGSCDVFGDVAAACYDGGYETLTKSQVSMTLSKTHWILSQGQIDVCNMMFNKGSYDQFMGKDPKSIDIIKDQVTNVCYTAMENIDARDFNERYGQKQ